MDGGEGRRRRGRIREEVSAASRENKSCCHANKAKINKQISFLNVESSYSASHYGDTLQQMAGGCQTKALVH